MAIGAISDIDAANRSNFRVIFDNQRFLVRAQVGYFSQPKPCHYHVSAADLQHPTLPKYCALSAMIRLSHRNNGGWSK